MAQGRLLAGRYELGGVIGRGGMAEVYRGRDIRLDRIVAVKTLRRDLAGDQMFQARFRREAQSAASLNHPSIIAVYDTGEDTGGSAPVPYIVMEYAEGRTLGDLMRDGRRLLPDRAMEITVGVLGALDYSHRNGIVHRDIKPTNVMLTRTGDVKVMDFGIARALAGGQVTLTQTAQVIGTVQYMSPEQARGERVDARSDLYSTGCLLYELLAGRPPFSGDSPVAIAHQHVRENPVPPSQGDPQIPRWADAIVLKAMAKNPEGRYQNAAEMRAAIQRAKSGTPVSAPPTQTVRQPQSGGGMTMAAPPAATSPGRAQDAGEPPDRRRRRAALWVLFGVLVLAAAAAIGYLALAGASGGKKDAVPQVASLTYQQASQEIVASHLQPRRIDQTSPSVQKGRVIATSPQEGSLVAAGSVVKVFVSAGRQHIPVPEVVGEDAAAARAKLAGAGLNPVTQTDTTSTAPAGTVVKQDPAGGTPVNPGSKVTIYVSAGGTRVQDVTGDPASTARSILQGQGFTVREIRQPGRSTAPAGTVYAQNPQAGTLLAQGTTVTIYIQPATTRNTITVTNPGSQAGVVGTAASLQIQASDSASGQTLTYAAAGLPDGLSINSASGLISGTPSAAGTASVTVTVTDTTGASERVSFTWSIT
jgi:eukaryotic-like serine/threonine-protein kinase